MKHKQCLSLVILCCIAFLIGVIYPLFSARAQQIARDVTINFLEVSRISDLHNEVKAYVTVTDLEGLPIKGLDESSFALFEDGVRVTQFKVEKASEALWVVLLMDTTTSMGATGLAHAKDAAKQFIRSMPAQDYIALYEFQEETRLLFDFEYDHGKVYNAVDELKLVDKWTCLYDAINTAVKKAMQVRQGRRAVVVMTDGRDDREGGPCSKVTVDEVIHLAYQHKVPIYTVGFGRRIDASILQRIARMTGGAYWAAPEPKDLGGVYREIAELLSSPYLIKYETSAAVGNHYLVIEVNYQGQQKLDSESFVILQPVGTATPEPTPTGTITPELTPTAPPKPDREVGMIARFMQDMRLLAILVTAGVIVFSVFMLLRGQRRAGYELKHQKPSLSPGSSSKDEETDDGVEVAKFTVEKSVKMREGQSFTITRDQLLRGKLTIGRSPDSDIRIEDKPVSRYHAELRYEHRRWYLYDVGSAFGTKVNDEPLPESGRELHGGDLIQLGTKTLLRFNEFPRLSESEKAETGEETRDIT